MEQINDFRIDPKSDSLENVKRIRNYIENFSNNSQIKLLINKTSEILEIPDEIINQKFKYVLYTKFSFLKDQPKFDLKLKKFNIILYFLYFIVLFFFNFFFFKKKKIDKKKVDVILDYVENIDNINRFKKLLLKFNSSLIITKKKLNITKQDNFIILEPKIVISNKILYNKKKKLLKLLIDLTWSSFKYDIKLIDIFFLIINTAIKYDSIFNLYKSKFLFYDRIYHSCSLRNFLFKKNGGLNALCFQSHIAEATISVFADIDTLITFGNECDTKKKLVFLGGIVNKIHHCGSLRMEFELQNEILSKQIKPIDILVIGLNPANWRGTSENILKIYYEQMSWVLKILEDFPMINLIYKHHPNFRGDSLETRLIKDKNIKVIVNTKDHTNTYHYVLKSNLILSFGSTMIIECQSLKKKCFFLDPDYKNTSFFGDLDYLNELRIKSYSELKTIIKTNLTKEGEKNILNSDKYCLSHQAVSERVYKYLSKI
jgi:hypothetical protein